MAPRQRLVRRRPLLERIQAYLDPVDWLYWLSEELEGTEWDQGQKEWANPLGLLLNIVFVIARANSASTTRPSGDDVFGDDVAYTSWSSWFASFVVHLLSVLSVANALYTLNRKRHYRLFESSVDAVPSTPSAKRVRVDSSPVASSPLRFLSTMLGGENAESRSHPDATRDVWEIAVWDPTPFALQMFCLLSPGHVLVYWLFLPTAVADPRPSTTVLTAVVLAALLSGQLLLLCSSFSQQSKDASLIHKEVMSEYDIKYVHPRTQPLMRDVGTQVSTSANSHRRTSAVDIEDESVDIYTPTFVLNRRFQTRPNPNYVKHVDPDGFSSRPPPSQGISTGVSSSLHTPAHLRDMSSPIRPQPQTAIRQPHFRPSTVGDGGSLGVYTHANSPLRNSRSADLLRPAGQRESLSPQKRQGSPLKRSSMAPTANGHRLGHLKASQPRRESGMF